MEQELVAVGYSLWRDGRLLGRMHVVFPTTDASLIGGLLHPSTEHVDIEPLIQMRMDHLPGRPVLQEAVGSSRAADQCSGAPKAYALRTLTPEELTGIEAARLLELRDTDGRTLELEMLTIHRADSRENRGEIKEACERLGVAFSPWHLICRVDRRGSLGVVDE